MTIKFSLLWKELLLFSSAQFLGIWSAFKFLPNISIPRSDFKLTFTFNDLIFLLIFGLIFFVLFKKFARGAGVAIKIFLILAVFSGSQIVFFSFMPENPASLAAFLLAILFIFVKRVIVQNIAMIFGIAGIGAVFGLSISPIAAVIVLLALSFYDIIAVYWTKHMVKMAEGMIRARSIFGLVIPEKAAGFASSMDKARPGEGFMVLGSGDVIMPIILSGAVVSGSLASAFMVGIFAVGGMVITHILFVNQKERRAMAALPPIAVMSILGYLLTQLF